MKVSVSKLSMDRKFKMLYEIKYSLQGTRNFVKNDYYFNGILIFRINKIKDLGVYVDLTFTFGCHVENSIASTSKMMGLIIRQSFNCRNVETLIRLYNSLSGLG